MTNTTTTTNAQRIEFLKSEIAATEARLVQLKEDLEGCEAEANAKPTMAKVEEAAAARGFKANFRCNGFRHLDGSVSYTYDLILHGPQCIDAVVVEFYDKDYEELETLNAEIRHHTNPLSSISEWKSEQARIQSLIDLAEEIRALSAADLKAEMAIDARIRED